MSIVARSPPLSSDAAEVTTQVLWDRKLDGGFPETKELKRRVRDVIEPGRDLGHVDRDYGQVKAAGAKASGEGEVGKGTGEGLACKDCE